MAAETKKEIGLEIGHVLFIDIVGYSKGLINEQSESLQKLKEIVRGTEKISLKKQGMEWKLADGRKAQLDRITGLLIAVEFERAQEILDTPGNPSLYGLDKSRIEVTLRQAGKDVLGMKFGAATHNPEGSYLKVSTNPAVMTVAEDFFAKFSLKADDLAETH